jgi:uncharacterized protein (TIGR00369 family)
MSAYGVAAPEEVAPLTGLEALRAMAEGRLPLPTVARTLGMKLGHVSEGEVAFLCAPSEGFLNPMGAVHGGWAMTLLDSALGCACHTTLARGETYASIDTSVRFVRAIRHGGGAEFRAVGRVVSRGRRVVVCDGRLEGPDGRLHATATSSCLVSPHPG